MGRLHFAEVVTPGRWWSNLRAMTTLASFLAAGPFHLSLSIGWFGFYAHAGFLLALEEAGFQPSSLSGASSGAIAASARASGLSSQEVCDLILSVGRRDFWDPGWGLGVLKGQKLRALLAKRLPVRRFEDAVIPLSLSSWSKSRHAVHVHTSGDLAAGVHASVAVPPLFMPAIIAGEKFVDVAYRDPFALSGVDRGRRILVHDLCSSQKAAEKLKSEPISSEVYVCRFSDRLPMGPFRMKNGAAAIDESYRRTKDLLGT
ncbi:MAG: patatin-like phospholipase family protein [Planctomycetota bacterium]